MNPTTSQPDYGRIVFQTVYSHRSDKEIEAMWSEVGMKDVWERAAQNVLATHTSATVPEVSGPERILAEALSRACHYIISLPEQGFDATGWAKRFVDEVKAAHPPQSAVKVEDGWEYASGKDAVLANWQAMGTQHKALSGLWCGMGLDDPFCGNGQYRRPSPVQDKRATLTAPQSTSNKRDMGSPASEPQPEPSSETAETDAQLPAGWLTGQLEETRNKEDHEATIKFYKESLVRIASLFGIESPLELILHSKEGDTYTDVLIRFIKTELQNHSDTASGLDAARTALAEKEAEVEMLKSAFNSEVISTQIESKKVRELQKELTASQQKVAELEKERKLFSTQREVELRAELTKTQIEYQAKEASRMALEQELTSLKRGGRLTVEWLVEKDHAVTGRRKMWPGEASDMILHLNALLVSPWIPLTERMPTEKDADINKRVIWLDNGDKASTAHWNPDVWNNPPALRFHKAWRTTDLPPLPTEKVEDGFEKWLKEELRTKRIVPSHDFDHNQKVEADLRRAYNAALAQGGEKS